MTDESALALPFNHHSLSNVKKDTLSSKLVKIELVIGIARFYTNLYLPKYRDF